MERFLRYANTPLVALLSLAAFLWLSWYSTHQEQGYTQAERDVENRIISEALDETRPVILTREQTQLASLYLDDGKPVDPKITAWAQRAVKRVRGH